MAGACRQAMVTPAVHGQNVQAYISNKICALGLDDLIEDSIEQWYMPVYRYGLTNANNMYTDPRLESFANMAFYKNTAVGCHYAECRGHNTARKVITCMYDNVSNNRRNVFKHRHDRHNKAEDPSNAQLEKKYDCELENLALAYAKKCTLVPSNTPTEGENVHSAPYQPDQYAAAKAFSKCKILYN
ncbi:hypothetical protein ANCDUO_06487 [Ancylostoma duodenale]|uniref:SCP domain-containing protein n=1 Tax=Ancylostoma duodenale TaxID=51022 RepID=A0A0C2DKV0_9BILA|nr:hypothetical protein ANCDUO_06487 [Ancylostoma duodenale]